jgi:hypothetical protein
VQDRSGQFKGYMAVLIPFDVTGLACSAHNFTGTTRYLYHVAMSCGITYIHLTHKQAFSADFHHCC